MTHGAHRRPARPRRAGEEQQLGRGVVELVGVHRVDEAQLVGHVGQVRHGVGEPDARLAVLGELPPRAQQLGRAGGEGEALALGELVGARLAVALDQLRLVVEQIEVRRRAGQVDVDHPLGLGGEVRLLGGQAGCPAAQRAAVAGRWLSRAARPWPCRAQAERRLAEEMPPRDRSAGVPSSCGFHSAASSTFHRGSTARCPPPSRRPIARRRLRPGAGRAARWPASGLPRAAWRNARAIFS